MCPGQSGRAQPGRIMGFGVVGELPAPGGEEKGLPIISGNRSWLGGSLCTTQVNGVGKKSRRLVDSFFDERNLPKERGGVYSAVSPELTNHKIEGRCQKEPGRVRH